MSKRDDDILLEGIRKRLENYSEPVPDRVWHSLEKELSPRRIPFRRSSRRWAAVAAAFAGVIALGWWLSATFTGEVSPSLMAGADAPQVQSAAVRERSPLASEAQDAPQGETLLAEAGTVPAARVARKHSSAPVAAAAKAAAAPLPQEEAVLPEEEAGNTRQEEPGDTVESVSLVQKRGGTRGGKAWRAAAMAEHRPKGQKKWSMGVSYLNTASVRNDGLSGFHTLKEGQGNIQVGKLPLPNFSTALPTEDKPMQDALLNNVGQAPPETRYEHKMPVSTGISFRYAFNEHFAIETGLTYTMLSSELESSSSAGVYVEEYKLHYIGIPVKGNWIFLDTKFLSLYLSAGFALEKSVAGKYERVYLSGDGDNAAWNETVKPMQWSLLGSVGVQFNATERFGIYVEPGVAHYFDDGSGVQTIRTEKPTNFNLQLGLRWSY